MVSWIIGLGLESQCSGFRFHQKFISCVKLRIVSPFLIHSSLIYKMRVIIGTPVIFWRLEKLTHMKSLLRQCLACRRNSNPTTIAATAAASTSTTSMKIVILASSYARLPHSPFQKTKCQTSNTNPYHVNRKDNHHLHSTFNFPIWPQL